MSKSCWFLLMAASVLGAVEASGPGAYGLHPLKPYRVLLVVDKWEDPASQIITSGKDAFQPVAAMLKAWSVPFDILRLDQQNLGASSLFDRSGSLRYGTLIWVADTPSYLNSNTALLQECAQAGMGLIAISSRFLDPALEKLLGLRFKEAYSSTDPLKIERLHFITRDVTPEVTGWNEFDSRLSVKPQSAQVLIAQQAHPVLTINQTGSGNSAIWIGAPQLKHLTNSRFWRKLFFRSLIWSLGYLIIPDIDYSHRFILGLDDWGTADKGFLSYWRYPTLSEEVMRQHLVAPLEKHDSVMAANVITGYVDRKTKRIISPWNQKFTDRYGVLQDYGSTHRGMKSAVAAGVLEIESHGWTHMQPDLDSAPGPWWNADVDGEASASSWYEEFLDRRRGIEVPVLTQVFHLKQSIEYLVEDFGERPLTFRAGGAAWSKSYANHTGLAAAQAGFGLFQAGTEFNFFLDDDLVLDMAGAIAGASHGYEQPLQPQNWPAHPDGPLLITAHDRDIAFEPQFLDKFFEGIPRDYKALSMNEYVGVLHTRIDSLGGEDWRLAFHFNPPYCEYLNRHASSWQLWLADPLLEELKNSQQVSVSIDAQAPAPLKRTGLLNQPVRIEIPPGLGQHTWTLSIRR
jgi:hypothetical protein